MSAGVDLLKKYPTIAHNYVASFFEKNGKLYANLNNSKRGFKHLLTWEPYTIRPENWDVNVINQFDSFITFNDKFCENPQITAKNYVTKYWSGGVIDVDLDTFKSYDEKIKGVCVFGKQGRDAYKKREGSIYFLRNEFLRDFIVEPFLVKHLYAHEKWGGEYYQGSCEPYNPWGKAALEKVNEYLFCFCPENTYHSLWSHGYLTERLLRCFRAKTVGIYIGCFNIDELVPKDLYIDFREFYGDYDRLADYLINFPKEKYLDMTERAYKWYKIHRIGLVEDFESMLKIIVGKENA